MDDVVLYEVSDGIAKITLNRPDQMNAWTGELSDELQARLGEADRDDEVVVVVITGAGKAFCAGADLSAGKDTFNNDAPGKQSGLQRDGGGLLTLRLFESKKPLISACNGPAVGVGATMQCAMDIRLASEKARYGFVFSRRAIVP
ncbi:MAG: enoyl-CoA hydratase, partial [Acidimicrobiaceae bacterium]|nr:enoyl-CoA hydratase [Acidimicrobiaceae bacterium]